MKLGKIEISEEEYNAIYKAIMISKAHDGKLVTKVIGTGTSTKVYLPKEWGGDRVVILNLGKKPKGVKNEK